MCDLQNPSYASMTILSYDKQGITVNNVGKDTLPSISLFPLQL